MLSEKRPLFGVCWISGSAVWGRDLFSGICVEFADGAILEEPSSPWHLWHLVFLAFVAFGTFGTGEGLLWYGICTRCAKQASAVRDAFSEALGANLSHLNQENTRPIVWRRRIRPYFRAGS